MRCVGELHVRGGRAAVDLALGRDRRSVGAVVAVGQRRVVITIEGLVGGQRVREGYPAIHVDWPVKARDVVFDLGDGRGDRVGIVGGDLAVDPKVRFFGFGVDRDLILEQERLPQFQQQLRIGGVDQLLVDGPLPLALERGIGGLADLQAGLVTKRDVADLLFGRRGQVAVAVLRRLVVVDVGAELAALDDDHVDVARRGPVDEGSIGDVDRDPVVGLLAILRRVEEDLLIVRIQIFALGVAVDLLGLDVRAKLAFVGRGLIVGVDAAKQQCGRGDRKGCTQRLTNPVLHGVFSLIRAHAM